MNQKPSILLIDDDNEVLDVYEVYLFRKFDIHTAVNGFEGLKKARELIPVCVITDIMMPVMDGIKFFNRFRQYEELKDIPVIASTSFTDTIREQSLMSVGFSTVIAKTIPQKALLTLINDLLRGKR